MQTRIQLGGSPPSLGRGGSGRRWRSLPAVVGGAAMMLLLGGLVAWAAGELTVTEMRSAIRKDKKTFAARLADLVEGDKLELLATEDPWLQVRGKGATGWILKSAVTDASKPVLSGTQAARGTTATNISQAGRGFNPKVEAQYRSDNPGLEEAYKLLDLWVSQPTTEEQVVAFIQEGKLQGGTN